MNAILSIKPEFVEEIFKGNKQYEYRKAVFKRPVEKVYIYSTSPVCRIVGEFKVNSILCSSPTELWEETKEFSGISRMFFDQYFEGRSIAYAFKLKDVVKYSSAVTPSSIFENFTAPQSFVYTDFNIKKCYEQR